ncbi:MAG: hypothetical protein U0793_08040 [Gemmataceae bacterium]
MAAGRFALAWFALGVAALSAPAREFAFGDRSPTEKKESAREIIERLHRNLDRAGAKLKDENDPSETTRRLQGEIIDDLDRLIGTPRPRSAPKEPSAKAAPAPKPKTEGNVGASATPTPAARPGKETTAREPSSKDFWPPLPPRDPGGVDALSRERMLPQYEKLLRKYYRNLAERETR